METQRKAFNFLRSYYDVLEDIHRDQDKLTYLMAILDKQFKGIEPELTGIPRLCYNGQRHAIDKSVEGWENKTKQKLNTPTEGGNEGPTEGGSQGGSEDPTKGPYQHPSGYSVMTTEGPTEDPSVQEKEQEEEEEQEEVEVKENIIRTNILGEKSETVKFYNQYRKEIELIRDTSNCSLDEAINIHFEIIQSEVFG